MGCTRRTLAAAVAVAIAALFGGCAVQPANAVLESLDESTGTSLTRLARPIELLAVEPRGPGADPFAYVAPFETNRMGRRRTYLWLAVPDERGTAAQPALSVAGRVVALGARQSVGDAGLALSPYARPAPWSTILVFELDATALRALAGAGEWRLARDAADPRSVFAGVPRPPQVVADFIARVGGPTD